MHKLLCDRHQKGYQLYPAKQLMPSIAEQINSPLDLICCRLRLMGLLVIEEASQDHYCPSVMVVVRNFTSMTNGAKFKNQMQQSTSPPLVILVNTLGVPSPLKGKRSLTRLSLLLLLVVLRKLASTNNGAKLKTKCNNQPHLRWLRLFLSMWLVYLHNFNRKEASQDHSCPCLSVTVVIRIEFLHQKRGSSKPEATFYSCRRHLRRLLLTSSLLSRWIFPKKGSLPNQGQPSIDVVISGYS